MKSILSWRGGTVKKGVEDAWNRGRTRWTDDPLAGVSTSGMRIWKNLPT